MESKNGRQIAIINVLGFAHLFLPILKMLGVEVFDVRRPGQNMFIMPVWRCLLGWVSLGMHRRATLAWIKWLMKKYPQYDFISTSHSIGTPSQMWAIARLTDNERDRIRFVCPLGPVAPQRWGQAKYIPFWKNGAGRITPLCVLGLVIPFFGTIVSSWVATTAFANSQTCHVGRIYKRRFLTPDSSLLLLQFLLGGGYMDDLDFVHDWFGDRFRIIVSRDDRLIPYGKLREAVEEVGGDPDKVIIHLPGPKTTHCMVQPETLEPHDADVAKLKQILGLS
ncbi:MAG: hypothetical protein HYV41_01825 [Candidatus Magasanikbacteria bacterium]|nr:hypothetical protein [Candidatus Magasanikbacteria bacterium]